MDMDLGEDYKEWTKWWKKNKKGFLVLPKAEPAEETEEDKKDIAKKNDPNRKRPKNPYKTASKPTSRPKFFGTEIYSSRVIFIIDISGSMSSSTQKTDDKGRSQSLKKIEYAKNELINAVRQLKKKAMFNLYFFESTFTKWKPRMVRASAGAKTAAVKWVQSMGPRGGTNIYDTVEDALGDPNVDTIYLLSDGSPGQGKWTRMEDILREVKKINEHKNVQINTISFGQDSELMRKLAEQNGGQYIYKK
jgi:Mg-chelatase subunit ChlD